MHTSLLGRQFCKMAKLFPPVNIIQSTLGFATMDIAANLDLATGRALTDLHQYINSDLVFSDLKFGPFIVK